MFTNLTSYMVPFYSFKIIVSEFKETHIKYSLFCPTFAKDLSKFLASKVT